MLSFRPRRNIAWLLVAAFSAVHRRCCCIDDERNHFVFEPIAPQQGWEASHARMQWDEATAATGIGGEMAVRR